jgi:hypothetical protein
MLELSVKIPPTASWASSLEYETGSGPFTHPDPVKDKIWPLEGAVRLTSFKLFRARLSSPDSVTNGNFEAGTVIKTVDRPLIERRDPVELLRIVSRLKVLAPLAPYVPIPISKAEPFSMQ